MAELSVEYDRWISAALLWLIYRLRHNAVDQDSELLILMQISYWSVTNAEKFWAMCKVTMCGSIIYPIRRLSYLESEKVSHILIMMSRLISLLLLSSYLHNVSKPWLACTGEIEATHWGFLSVVEKMSFGLQRNLLSPNVDNMFLWLRGYCLKTTKFWQDFFLLFSLRSYVILLSYPFSALSHKLYFNFIMKCHHQFSSVLWGKRNNYFGTGIMKLSFHVEQYLD